MPTDISWQGGDDIIVTTLPGSRNHRGSGSGGNDLDTVPSGDRNRNRRVVGSVALAAPLPGNRNRNQRGSGSGGNMLDAVQPGDRNQRRGEGDVLDAPPPAQGQEQEQEPERRRQQR